VRRYPRSLNAAGAAGWTEDTNETASDEKDARWDEYSRLGSIGLIEREWSRVMKSLGSVERSTPESRARNECKLCGGVGKKRCGRCMGAAKASSGLACTACSDGMVSCEWCNGSGSS
jgi:hypothetical protein